VFFLFNFSFRFHKDVVFVHFIVFLVTFLKFDSQKPFEVSDNDSTAGIAATHHVLAHLLNTFTFCCKSSNQIVFSFYSGTIYKRVEVTSEEEVDRGHFRCLR